MSTTCILVAAGSGTRLAAGTPKAFVLLEGVPLLAHAIRGVLRAGVCSQLVLVVPSGREDEALTMASVVPGASACRVVAVSGGSDRRSSVVAGLAVLDPETDVVLVHDAARCLTPPEQIASVAAAVVSGLEAVVPGLQVDDTVRSVGLHRDGGPATTVLDRDALRLVQTPQGFRRSLLESAHAAVASTGDPAALAATDDASLVELLGGRVHVVPGCEEAMKVTRPFDLAVAGVLLRAAAGTS